MTDERDDTRSRSRLQELADDLQTLLAGPLALYQEREGLDEVQLAAFLGGDHEALVRLALCRRPRLDPVYFRDDVKHIAAYAKVSPRPLARLVRVGAVYEHQQRLDAERPSIVAEADRTVECWETTGWVTCVVCDVESLFTGPDSTCEQCGRFLIPFA